MALATYTGKKKKTSTHPIGSGCEVRERVYLQERVSVVLFHLAEHVREELLSGEGILSNINFAIAARGEANRARQ
jgi:hypothetical protein